MQYPATDTSLTEARRLPDAKALQLTWSDGARARPTYDQLQGYCPCAHCRGHGGGEITYQSPDRPIQKVEIRPVGNYAIAIGFAPGCNAGIFHFDFLREMCRRESLLEGGTP
ncbi:MAG: DUF971 domain-containing protein [Acidobacteriota bacterium]